jgi:hypothetical protein
MLILFTGKSRIICRNLRVLKALDNRAFSHLSWYADSLKFASSAC